MAVHICQICHRESLALLACEKCKTFYHGRCWLSYVSNIKNPQECPVCHVAVKAIDRIALVAQQEQIDALEGRIQELEAKYDALWEVTRQLVNRREETSHRNNLEDHDSVQVEVSLRDPEVLDSSSGTNSPYVFLDESPRDAAVLSSRSEDTNPSNL